MSRLTLAQLADRKRLAREMEYYLRSTLRICPRCGIHWHTFESDTCPECGSMHRREAA
ncbi:MAG: hypothetical protein M0T85_15705 [Dehalococcoidales bacterium]|nr:hypothetical protein [Dehalococcoidales bacterium]